MTTLTITKPDDWHVHLRDGAQMACVLPDTIRQFGRAIIMPNLKPPVTTVAAANSYQQQIQRLIPAEQEFTPLMTIYLTDQTSITDIQQVAASDSVYAIKYYPVGATTNSAAGVTDILRLEPVLNAMSEYNVPLLMHGEVTHPDVDIFDREAVFIEKILHPLRELFPALRIVFEHISTAEAVAFVSAQTDNLAATITPQHLLLNRNALFAGGLQTHNYCLPVLKAEQHREAVLAAAVSGDRRFFLGTDSAPHARSDKESSCGCAGIYSAYHAMSLYAEAFERAGRLDALEGFSSHHGADFYALPRNTSTLTLHKKTWQIPRRLVFADDSLVPFLAGEHCTWQMQAT